MLPAPSCELMVSESGASTAAKHLPPLVSCDWNVPSQVPNSGEKSRAFASAGTLVCVISHRPLTERNENVASIWQVRLSKAPSFSQLNLTTSVFASASNSDETTSTFPSA